MHLRFAPVRMLEVKPRCFELPRRFVERLRDLKPPPRGHFSDETGLDAFGVG